MQLAWTIAKQAATKFGGSSYQYLSLALKLAWSEMKKPDVSLVEKLIAAGGKRWTKSAELDRIYFEACLVLSVAGYASTGIRSQVPAGKKFFPYSLKKFRAEKFFYDIAKAEFNFSGYNSVKEEFLAGI